jgi:glycosyltransferase involved in cell wall biosynthesis
VVKKIAILSVASKIEKNGVITFVNGISNLLEKNPEYGYIVSEFCGGDSIFSDSTRNSPVFSSVLNFIKNGLRNILARTDFGAIFLIHFTYVKRANKAVAGLLNRNTPDLIFSQDIFCSYLILKNSTINVPLIGVDHSGQNWDEQLKGLFPGSNKYFCSKYLDNIARTAFNKSACTVTLTAVGRDNIEMRYGVKGIEVIANTAFPRNKSIESDLYCRGDVGFDMKSLVFVGSIQYRKGIDLLINAIISLPYESASKICLHILGDGDLRESLERKLKLGNCVSSVVFYGKVDNPDPIINNCDVFCLPSRDEGMSIALLEAMQLGKAILATPVGSVPEMFSDNEYIRVEPFEESIRDRLIELVHGKYDINKLGQNARFLFETRYSPCVFLERYVSIFDRVIDANLVD